MVRWHNQERLDALVPFRHYPWSQALEAREFTLEDEYQYNRTSPARWIISHVFRYPLLPVLTVLLAVLSISTETWARMLVGQAFDELMSPSPSVQAVLLIALTILGAKCAGGVLQLTRNLSVETLAQRFERDARDELYVSLLGKSLSFHSQQRIGDIMARATNDVHQLNLMVSPGLALILNSVIHVVIPIAGIGTLSPQLLIIPTLFVGVLAIALRSYSRRLNPVAEAARKQFGTMNADLAKSIS